MATNNCIVVLSLFLTVLVQLVNVPFLGDIHAMGKIYVFLFSFLFILLFSVAQKKCQLTFAYASWPLVVGWGLFAVFSFNADHSYAVWQFLGVLGVLICWSYWTSSLMHYAPRFFNYFCESLIVVGVISSLLGLYEYFYFLWAGSTSEMLLPFLLPPKYSIRVGGIYGQPNLYALLMIVTLLAIFYLYIHNPVDYCGKLFKWCRFLLPILISLNFFLTLSRAGILAFILCLLVLIWLTSTRRYLSDNPLGKKEFFSLLMCVVFSFCVAKLLAFVTGSGHVSRPLGADIGQNVSSRFVYMTSALLMFLDHPFQGIGLGNFKYLLSGYEINAHDLLGFVEYEAMTPTNWAHNEILQLLCEGGILIGVCIFLLVAGYFKLFIKTLIPRKISCTPEFLYSHLLILPFLVQSMFSWPLRHFPLLIIFFALLGIIYAQYPLRCINLNSKWRALFIGIGIFGLVVTGVGLKHELKLGHYRVFLSDKGIPLKDKFSDFEALTRSSYSEFRVLNSVLWKFVGQLNSSEDHISADRLLPYSLRLIEIQGTSSQWYNLALIYLRLQDRNAAKSAVTRAVEINPVNDAAWDLMHFINVLAAAEHTGRSVESYYSGQSEKDILRLLGSLHD